MEGGEDQTKMDTALRSLKHLGLVNVDKNTCRIIIRFYMYRVHIPMYVILCPIHITYIHVYIYVRILSTYLHVACQCGACV